MSNALERSKKHTSNFFFEVKVEVPIIVALRIASWVEVWGLNPNWQVLQRGLFSNRWTINLLLMIFSSSFDGIDSKD